MGVRRYQDLVAWQLARELERRVFAFTDTDPARKDFEYCRQIRRAGSSAPRNIAEGFGRFQPGDFARFVRIARGSLNETNDHLDAGLERHYVSPEEHQACAALADRALGAATRLAAYLDKAAETWPARRREFRNNRRGPKNPQEP